MQFFDALVNHTFMQNALLIGVLAGVACGVVGAYVVARRITYIAGGISHSALGGIGVAHYLIVVYGWHWLDPVYGAAAAALAAALTIGWVSLKGSEREDTVIGAIWAIGMAVGILFISQTPGYNQQLMGYLFGNILMVSSGDIWLVTVLDLVIVAIGILFYRQFHIVCFDEEFARTRGINVEFYYLLLLSLTALTVIVLVTVVGIVMVIALITLPVAIAGRFSRTLWQTMLLAAGISVVVTTLGLAVSFGLDFPTGATTILIAGVAYLLVTFGSSLFRSRQA
ncbi:MAG: metal ABC transporter permease [candidate division Zixibacteria bacterium]|jgi:zinc transport system permease protein|nr:metal ABC transporter permease [candidate division Zixibacteria bacterium]